jgi:prepilin-type N-terminal cleavage/methylation domain-containing protein
MRGKKTAFTLLELMIAVGIISLLAIVAIPQFVDLIGKSKEATTKGNLAILRTAVSVYYADNEGMWPQQNKILDNDATWHYESSWYPGATGVDTRPGYFEDLMVMQDNDTQPKYLERVPKAYIGQNWRGAGGFNKEGTSIVGTYHIDVQTGVPGTGSIARRGPDTEWLWEVWMYCCDTGEVWVNANKFAGPRFDTKGKPITSW